MKIEEVVQKLPWLMNGTLDESEAEQVRKTLRESEACRVELRELAEAGVLFGGRIPKEVLLSYITGDEVAPYDGVAIERLLDASLDGGEEWQMARESWNATQRAATESEESTRNGAGGTVVPFERPLPTPAPAPAGVWRPAAIAASLLAVLGLGGWWNAAQETSPVGYNPVVVEVGALASDEVLRSGATESEVVERSVLEITQLSLTATGGARTLELLDPSGRSVWAPDQEFRADKYGNFLVALPRDLAPGFYTVQLYEGAGEPREAAESYAIELR